MCKRIQKYKTSQKLVITGHRDCPENCSFGTNRWLTHSNLNIGFRGAPSDPLRRFCRPDARVSRKRKVPGQNRRLTHCTKWIYERSGRSRASRLMILASLKGHQGVPKTGGNSANRARRFQEITGVPKIAVFGTKHHITYFSLFELVIS